MKPLIEQKDYEKSIYKSFGIFPFYLLLIATVVAYGIGLIMAYQNGLTNDVIFGSETFANAFFRGTLGTVVIFYIARFSSIRSSQKSESLKDLDEVGHYITCMSHNSWRDFSYGNLIIESNRIYFQPDIQTAMELNFDYKNPSELTFSLGKPYKSIGLYLVTGMKQMVEVKDKTGNLVGQFIMAQPDVHLESIKALL